MGHNLDITNGRASYVGARQDAWHSLGVTLPDGFTAEQAMEEGLLGGWNVRKAPLLANVGDTELVPVPGRYAVVRDNPVSSRIDVLGNVGEAYRVIQNEEHAALLNALVDESGAHFETAGAIDGGRRVFVTMKMPGHLLVGGVDRVEMYIAAVNSHDGTLPFTIMVTPVRIVCQNTLNLALGGASRSYRVRHTRAAGSIALDEARKALDLTFNYLDGFQDLADRLINTTMTQMEFEKIIDREFGVSVDAPQATVTRTGRKLDEMASLFSDSATHEGVRNTAWAGLNAMTEWADHFSPTRGTAREATRAAKAVLEPEFKDRALAVVRRYVGA